MINSRMSFIHVLFLCFTMVLFTQCTKEQLVTPDTTEEQNDDQNNNNQNNDDDPTNAKTGTVNLKMTDAPIDNVNIEGVFVTVAEIKVDGEIYEGFQGKQTIDVLALQNGKVEGLGMSELETGTYHSITLILDHSADENGDAPGCFILTTDGIKESLNATAGTTQEIRIMHNFEVEEDSQTDFVIDFDLRKAITGEGETTNQTDYSFVTDAELQASLRVVAESAAGTISGTCTENPLFQSDKIIVFAYEKGEFDMNTEFEGQGQSNIQFANAVTSASVDANGKYQISFLEDSEYELIFCSYEEESEGRFVFKGMLQLNVDLGIDLGNVKVDARSETTVDVLVTGIIPL